MGLLQLFLASTKQNIKQRGRNVPWNKKHVKEDRTDEFQIEARMKVSGSARSLDSFNTGFAAEAVLRSELDSGGSSD
jgi:hypothetical protein